MWDYLGTESPVPAFFAVFLFSHAEAGENGLDQVVPDVFSVQLPQSLQGGLGIGEHHVRGHADAQGTAGAADGGQSPGHGVGLAGIGQQLPGAALPGGVQGSDGVAQDGHPLAAAGGQGHHVVELVGQSADVHRPGQVGFVHRHQQVFLLCKITNLLIYR